MAHFGYLGRILRVDLGTGAIDIEEPSDDFYRLYLGGRALIARYLLREISTGSDPLGSGNCLIFSSGPVTGAPVSGSGRHAVGAKSPLTGGIASSEAGGYWGAELKHAGFDAIIVKGISSKPVYLWISEGKAELRDAIPIWHKTTAEADEWLRKELGSDRIQISMIGPAGENLVKYANVVSGLRYYAGRGGLGAVMGSKRLKAVVVLAKKGGSLMKIADMAKVTDIARWLASNQHLVEDLYDTGTAGGIIPQNMVGGLPSFNFRHGQFEQAESISGEQMRDSILVSRDTCFACAVRCKRTVELTQPFNVSRKYGGPEYESIAGFGSNLGIDNLALIAHINALCASNGLDTISAGGSIAFAMECFEAGLLTINDTDGLDLHFGNDSILIPLIMKIIRREGIGDLLSQGVRSAAEQIGGSAREFAMHVKGQELPYHEPRMKMGMGLGYAVSPTGADHEHNMHDTDFVSETLAYKRIKEFADIKPMRLDDLTGDKVKVFTLHSNWQHLMDCLIMCRFLPYNVTQVLEIVRGVTGWDVDKWELMNIGRKAATLSRLYNLREGIEPEDDNLPGRFNHPFEKGPLAGVGINTDIFEQAKRRYYIEMDWDERGYPIVGKLAGLGINDIIDFL